MIQPFDIIFLQLWRELLLSSFTSHIQIITPIYRKDPPLSAIISISQVASTRYFPKINDPKTSRQKCCHMCNTCDSCVASMSAPNKSAATAWMGATLHGHRHLVTKNRRKSEPNVHMRDDHFGWFRWLNRFIYTSIYFSITEWATDCSRATNSDACLVCVCVLAPPLIPHFLGWKASCTSCASPLREYLRHRDMYGLVGLRENATIRL